MLRLFKRNDPLASVIIVILALILWIPSLIKPTGIEAMSIDSSPSILYFLLIDKISISARLSVLISLAIVLFVAFYIAQLNTKYLLLNTRTQFPALFFIALLGSVSILHFICPVYFALILFLFVINRIFNTYRKEKLAYTYFDVAILLAIGSMFYFESLVFLITFWVALVLLKPSTWREFIFPILGLMLSYIFLIVILYLIGINFIDFYAQSIPSLLHSYHLYRSYLGFDYYILYVVLGILIIIGSAFMIKGFQLKKIHARRYFQFFLWLFLICILAFFAIPSVDLEIVAFFSIPIVFLLANYFVYCKSSIWNEIIFDAFFVLVITIRYIHFLAPSLMQNIFPMKGFH